VVEEQAGALLTETGPWAVGWMGQVMGPQVLARMDQMQVQLAVATVREAEQRWLPEAHMHFPARGRH
jgi:hypothetical protein